MADKKKRTFDDDDLFKRKPYAVFLKNLILKCDDYHRDDDVKAYTIAMDSPWGTGKSVFLEKFESMLEQDCKDQLCVVHYNAWENDFWDNAFEPFASAVFSHPLFASSLADQTEGKALEKVGSAVKHLAIAFTKKRLEDYFDPEQLAEAGGALAGAVGAYTSQYPNAVSPAYSAYKENLNEMQTAMKTVLQEFIPDGKLVIIIDELDRCRPTFAIETLEIAKHIMDVPNVVYLFSLDIQQLGAAIKKVYGAETDATAYLMRFFSYYSRLPEATVDAMISKLIDGTKNINEKELVKEDLISAVSHFPMSPRDIETIGKVFRLMLDTFLSAYNNRQAYLLYWILLCTKYKEPTDFANLSKDFLGKVLKTFTYTSSEKRYFCVKTALELVQDRKTLESCSFSRLSIDSTRKDSEKPIYKTEPYDGKNRIKIVWKYGACSTIVDTDFGEDLSLSGILFTQDLLHWDEIKKLTPGQFLFQQMEMFNFLPDIQ